MTAGAAYYAKQNNTYFIRLIGEIRYTVGWPLDDFLDRLFKRADFDDIVIDLTEAEFIDSTNLGLLAKIANCLRNRFGKKTTLVSTNENINKVLDSVGFDEIFTICGDPKSPVETGQKLATISPRQDEITKTVLESHTRLSKLNVGNREMFKDVLETIERELPDKT